MVTRAVFCCRPCGRRFSNLFSSLTAADGRAWFCLPSLHEFYCYKQGCGSDPFPVEAEAQKFYRFRFHIGGRIEEEKKLVLLSFGEERIGRA